jgi:thioredoxin reductase (NADPH)
MAQNFDVIVIGEGISGLTSASHATKAGLRVATIESTLFGGLVLNVNELDGYPGAESGTNLASELMQSNADAGVTSLQEEVTGINAKGGTFDVTTREGSYGAKQVVVASGARLKKLGVPGEKEFEGKGVSSCADCDAPMYQNEEVIVVGGGDSALQEALVLSKFCKTVHVVHHGDKLTAQKHLIEHAKADAKISYLWNSTVEAILGGKMVEKVRVKRDGKSEEIPVAGIFAYVGLEPNAAFVPQAVARDAGGFLVTNAAFETAVPGLHAVGAVRAGYSGLLKDAAAEAKNVAESVRKRLAGG